MAALRVLFVPLFMAIQRLSSAKEVWAQNIVLQVLAMALMAFSNGYVSTLSMMLGPEQSGVTRHEKEPVGTIMPLRRTCFLFELHH